MIDRFAAFLRREGSTRPAALIRIGIALLLWTRFAADVAPWTDARPARLALAASFYLSTTCMLAGWLTRLATAWAGATALAMVYGFGPAGVEPWTHHHTTLLAHATALLALTPCGRSYGVDRWLAVRAAERADRPPPAERGPTWATALLAVQVTILYLSTAWDKCTPAFLSGERLQHSFMVLYWGADPVPLPGFAALCMAAAWLVVLVEFALPVALWFRRTRPAAIATGLALHALFYVLLPVGTFSATMAVLYLAFLDPDEVHRFLDRLQGHRPG